MNQNPIGILSCPLPLTRYPQILLAHGGGGRLMHQLIEQLFLPAFGNPLLAQRHDGVTLDLGQGRLAFTTDSYVVHPLRFPGGDIGSLAVNGTVNDLAMCGARPIALSAAFILEEGIATELVWEIAQSMQAAAQLVGVPIVTGDTKVVDHGKGDGIFLTTAGIGLIRPGLVIGPDQIQPGDAIVINGDIGRHGIAIMAVREGLAFESTIESDSTSLAELVQQLLDAGIEVHCMRDATRGGLASVLVELAQARKLKLHIDEQAVPIHEEVRGACEILGLDPLYIANEGRFVCILPQAQAQQALMLMRTHPAGAEAQIIGEVGNESQGLVTMTSMIGAERIIDMLSGEQLPRIC